MNKFFITRRITFTITLIIVTLDQLSKYIISNILLNTEPIIIIPRFIQLTFVTNYGAAFSLFNNYTSLLKYISLIASLILSLLVLNNYYKSNYERIALSLLLGGSIGNGIDRWAFGYVRDFIDFKIINFPIFNVADISINIAILLILIYQLTKSNRKKGINNPIKENIKIPSPNKY